LSTASHSSLTGVPAMAALQRTDSMSMPHTRVPSRRQAPRPLLHMSPTVGKGSSTSPSQSLSSMSQSVSTSS